MHSGFPGCWLLWSRLFSPIFPPHIPLCVSLCPIFPASSSSVVSSFLSLEEELLSLLSFPVFTPFHPLSLFLLFFLFPLVLSFLPCFLLLHSHFLLISPLSFQLFLSFLLCSVTLFFLSVLLSFYILIYISFFPPIFYIYIATPCITFKSLSVSLSPPPSLFQALCFPVLPSHFLFVFLPLSISLPSCLLLCSPSVFVLAVLAYSAGSTPAMPIILTEEKEKEKEKGKEGDGRRRRRGEGWKTCACVQKRTQIPTFMLMEGKNKSGWRA